MLMDEIFKKVFFFDEIKFEFLIDMYGFVIDKIL